MCSMHAAAHINESNLLRDWEVGCGVDSASISAPDCTAAHPNRHREPATLPKQPQPGTPAPTPSVRGASRRGRSKGCSSLCSVYGNKWKTATNKAADCFRKKSISIPAESWPTSEVLGSQERS